MPEEDFFEWLRSPVDDDPASLSSDRRALDQLFRLTYEELLRLAAAVRRNNPGCTLSPTALVNEAWLRLAKSPALSVKSPMHFKRIAARAMRQLLIEAARRRSASKRGGAGDVVFVTFDESLDDVDGATAERFARELISAYSASAGPNGPYVLRVRLNLAQAFMIERKFADSVQETGTVSLLSPLCRMLRSPNVAPVILWKARATRAKPMTRLRQRLERNPAWLAVPLLRWPTA